ncbi:MULTISPECIES: DNA-formamidopyrimidine glycosylase [Cytobacillus]|uniref:DNA-formamidopyrimidine glycosylase n=1 Tax=Cytobacillus TaxID=2675230 RepID=UPI0024802982|nr:DNA-formamidopyrimidine glycosylase [Cytobacillus kochii]
MPELPEVETVRRTLEELIIGKTIDQVLVHWPKMVKEPDDVVRFTKALEGETFKAVARRGKFLILYTDDLALVSHLRMEGRYGVYPKSETIDKHTHVIFSFTDGTELRYKDVRKFGTMHLFKRGDELGQLPLSQLGVEPLSDAFSPNILQNVLNKTARPIKAALLDQKLIVGLGNIYVDESLFKAGIHPERSAKTLTKQEVEKLYTEIKATLSEAVERGGSTIRSYVNSQGQIGLFQLELFVYGRRGEECKVCATPLERIIAGGRGTVYCPQCQPKKK